MKALHFVGLVILAAGLLAGCGPPVPEAPTALPPTLVFPTREPPTPAPTSTPLPEPSAAPVEPAGGSADEPLVLPALDPMPPEDVIAEMYEAGGGAGGNENCVEPPAAGSVLETRIPGTVALQFCWSDPDTRVRLAVTTPDLQKEVYELPVKPSEQGNYLVGLYPVDLSRPPGLYHFQLEGGQRQVSFSVHFAPARLPVVYEVLEMSDEWRFEGAGTRHRLHLAGFAPNEPLRLLVYHVKGGVNELVGWQLAAAGPDGQVWVAFELEEELKYGWLAVIAVGPVSGEVHLRTPLGSAQVSMENWTAVCPGTLPSRLSTQMQARTLAEVKVYAESSANSALTGSLAAGTTVSVLTGPYCREGARWWVIANGEVGGYAREADGSEYLLEPATE